jgi:hypothetical protein
MSRRNRIASASACLIAGALASCFIKPDPPGGGGDAHPGSDASGGDGQSSSDAAMTSPCANPTLTIHFPGMTLPDCGNFWAVTNGGPIGTSGGPLMIQTQLQNVGSCTSHTTGGGAAINIVATPGAPNDTLFLHALTQAAHVTNMRVVISAGARTLELSGLDGVVTVSYNDVAMKWLRLSADGPTTLVGEYSADGAIWERLGTQSTAPDSALSVTMSFGVSSTAAGSGAIDDYIQCR